MTVGKRQVRWCVLTAFAVALCSPLVARPSAALLGKLNSDDFQVRIKAHAELRDWAQKNIASSPEQLHKEWMVSRQPEVRSRCFELMKEVVIQRQFGKGRGFIGIQMQETIVRGAVDKRPRKGVQITMVMADTPGEKAGLKMNDIILGVDKLDLGKAGARPAEGAFRMDFGTVTRFSEYIQSKQPDETITLHILRNAEKIDVKIKLMKRPASADIDTLGRRLFDREDEKKQYFRAWLKSMAVK